MALKRLKTKIVDETNQESIIKIIEIMIKKHRLGRKKINLVCPNT